MHSYLICDGTEKTRMSGLSLLIAKLRDEKPKPNPLQIQDPDIHLLLPMPTITIDAIRELKKKLKLKPLASKVKVAVIASADSLTFQAQHALLKTLEEPTPDTFLILEVANPFKLLETIRSRCQLIKAPRAKVEDDNLDQAETLLTLFLHSSPGARLSYVEKFKKKEEAVRLMESILGLLHTKMQERPSWAGAAKLTHETLDDLKGNVNTSLALGHFALHFPKTDKEN